MSSGSATAGPAVLSAVHSEQQLGTQIKSLHDAVRSVRDYLEQQPDMQQCKQQQVMHMPRPLRASCCPAV